MYKFNLLTKLIGVMLLQFGTSTGALALDIRVSFAPEQQIMKLERAGFECGAALAAYDAPVACLRQNQIVTLNGAQLLCRSQVGKDQRQVCIERWRIGTSDRNIRTTAWNRTAIELSSRTGSNGYGAPN